MQGHCALLHVISLVDWPKHVKFFFLFNAQENTDAIAGQQNPVERAQSDAHKSLESAPLERSILPKASHLASGQLSSKADLQSAAQALSQLPDEAAADQSSVHAGSDQSAQHSRALSSHENPGGISHPNSQEISTGVAGIAADLHHQYPALVCSSPNGADQSSGNAPQRASARSLMKHPGAVTHSANVPNVHGSCSGACERDEACGPGVQPEATTASVADMADHSSRKDPQGSTGAPQKGLEAAHSTDAVRPSSEVCSAVSSLAEDAPECSPADDEPVLVENQVTVPPGKRLSQSSGKTGVSLDGKGSDFSKSQDPGFVEKTNISAEQAAAAADLDVKPTIASAVEAANKENSVSSALLAALDSRAQAVMEEEQAKATAAAAAQVVLSCLSACCPSRVKGSMTSRQLHRLDGSLVCSHS